MLLRTAFVACFAGAVFASAHRQCPGQVPQIIQVKPIDVSGTIVNVRPGIVTMNTPTGELWGLRIPPGIEVRVTGKAYSDVLKPGLHIRFLARVDKRRSLVRGKVDKLTIITPSKEDGRMPGVFLAAAPPKEEQPNGDAPRDKASPFETKLDTFDIRARIVASKGNWLTLHVPNEFFKSKLRIELAEQPEIDLDVANYSISKAGDTLKARGVRVGPQLVQAMAVRIELAKPLGKDKKRATRNKTGKKPSPNTGTNPTERPSDQMPDNKKPDETGEPVIEKPESDDKDSKDKETEDADTDKLSQFLKTKQGELKVKPSLKLSLDGTTQEIFAPCTAETAKNLKAKFGEPKKLASVSGKLPIGKDNAQQEVRWQLWDYGAVRILVDEVGDLRYFSVKKVEKKEE